MGEVLPKNWAECQLVELLESLQTGVRPKGGVQGITEGVPSVGGEHLNADGGFKFKNIKYIPTNFADKLKRGKISYGDILIVKDGATTGRTSFVANNFPFSLAFVNEHVFLCRSHQELVAKYIYYFMRSKIGQDRIMANFAGAAQGGINTKFASNTLVSLAPLAEQKRIVAKLDKLFAQIEGMKKALERIPQLLKDFRQQVLAQAVMGKLTEDWRKGKNQKAYSFEELNKYREEIKSFHASKSGKSKVMYKMSSEVNLGENTKGIEYLYNIPNSWLWVNLDQVTWNVSDGPHFSPKYINENEGKRFISMRNVSVNGVDFSDCKYVSVEDHNQFVKRGKPETGDLLYTKGGSTGIACVLDTDLDFSYWVHVALLKVVKKVANPIFLRNALNSPMCYKQSQAFTHGVGNQDLGLTRMIYITFPLPPLTEQNEIISRVESLFAKANKIEEKYKVLKASIANLPHVILSKAFKGELVEQLPTDGDARDLSEEIKKLKINK